MTRITKDVQKKENITQVLNSQSPFKMSLLKQKQNIEVLLNLAERVKLA